MSKIKNENYYIIHGWMLNELKLKGAQLQVYSIIYGFSQDGESEFTGSLNYLCDWLGVSKPTVIKALQELVEKGFVLKNQLAINGVTFNKYKVNQEILDSIFNRGKETLPPSKEILLEGSKETLLGGSKEILPNKEITNKELDKDIYKEDIYKEYIYTNESKKAQKKSATDKAEAEKMFCMIWELYPKGRKQGKPSARKHFMKALKDGVDPEVIKQKLLDYKKQIEIQGTELRYVKMASTWFNGGWEDEYITDPRELKGGKSNGEPTGHNEDPFANAHWNRLL